MQIDHEKIMEAKEKLGDENALIIARELNIQDFDEKNLRCCCPFHQEDHASFIYNRKNYSFHCFGSCGKNYDILDVFIHNGATYLEACQKLFDLAGVKYSFGEIGVKTKHQYKYPKEVPKGDRSKVDAYFKLRGISPETLDYADVRQDEHGNIVWNYYDTNDVLTMVKYRPSRKIKKGENKCWCQKGADTSPLLFNMNRINTTSPLLICEGEPDCLTAIEVGFANTVSVPLGSNNYHWIEENWDWLNQFETIIVCSDNDDAGIRMQKEVVYRLGTWRTKVVDIPPVGTTVSGDRVQIKDLNEALYYGGKTAVLNLILNARDSPVQGVVDFSDIQDIDLDAIDGVKTGIRPLDRYLMKLFQGTLNIVTGINGAGKSSFLNQLICQALEEDKNVFLFSGELPNFQAKNWLNAVLAGQRNLEARQYEETTYYKVRPDAKRAIDEYYRGRLFVYEDGRSHKMSDLLKTIEDSVRKYGTKLLILDNLTSINLECSDDSKYEKQAELVTQLIDFAVKFNVIIVLVVHPHKIEAMRRLNKMDVQGISAIIDLAHRIISLYRVSEADHQGKQKLNGSGWLVKPIKEDVLIDILKDRMLGFEGRSVGVFYDNPSRRFFTNEKDLDRRYAWDKKQYTGDLPFPPKQLEDAEDEVFGKINGDGGGNVA